MYLIDEEQNVVYPKNADKEDLWIIMNKAETDYCSTFKKYVALTNLNDDDINFLNGKNVIVDLAGHFIRNKENVSTDIVATNGLVIGTGITSQGETDNSYEYIETTKEAFKDQTVIENKVVEITQINVRDITDGVVTFRNCYFYGDKQSDNYSFAYLGNAVFENCYFYDFTNNPLNTGESGCESLTIKNCSFINCKKAISIYMSCGANVVIDGCNFYGTTGDGRGNIQLSNYTETNKTSLTIKNCVFHEMNSNQAGLIIIHEGILTSPGTQTADGIHCENNTVLGNTPTSKYVVNDDGKADSAFEPFNDSFREAVRSVFVASVK